MAAAAPAPPEPTAAFDQGVDAKLTELQNNVSLIDGRLVDFIQEVLNAQQANGNQNRINIFIDKVRNNLRDLTTVHQTTHPIALLFYELFKDELPRLTPIDAFNRVQEQLRILTTERDTLQRNNERMERDAETTAARVRELEGQLNQAQRANAQTANDETRRLRQELADAHTRIGNADRETQNCIRRLRAIQDKIDTVRTVELDTNRTQDYIRAPKRMRTSKEFLGDIRALFTTSRRQYEPTVQANNRISVSHEEFRDRSLRSFPPLVNTINNMNQPPVTPQNLRTIFNAYVALARPNGANNQQPLRSFLAALDLLRRGDASQADKTTITEIALNTDTTTDLYRRFYTRFNDHNPDYVVFGGTLEEISLSELIPEPEPEPQPQGQYMHGVQAE